MGPSVEKRRDGRGKRTQAEIKTVALPLGSMPLTVVMTAKTMPHSAAISSLKILWNESRLRHLAVRYASYIL